MAFGNGCTERDAMRRPREAGCELITSARSDKPVRVRRCQRLLIYLLLGTSQVTVVSAGLLDRDAGFRSRRLGASDRSAINRSIGPEIA